MLINVPAGNFNLTLGADAFLLNTANIYLQCQTGGGAVNIILPRITTIDGITTTWGFKIYVNDVGNNASVNNITITPHPADKINSVLATPVVLNTNGATGHLQVTGLNSWEFNSSALNGGGLTNIESGTFSLADDGLSATINGVPYVLNAVGSKLTGTAASPILTIDTIKKLKLWFGQVFDINSVDPNAPSIYSDGRSNGIIQTNLFSQVSGGGVVLVSSPAILVSDLATGNGWSGSILTSGITSTSYTIAFTRGVGGSGLDISGKWHGITG